MFLDKSKEKIDTNDLFEITDQVDLQAFINKNSKTGKKEIILRIYKEGVFEGAGLDLGEYISDKLLQYFDENGNLKCSK